MATSVTFTDKQLNYLKFISVVVDEFTKALRQTFISLWNNKYGTAPGYQPWDDSLAVRTMFKKLEGTKSVPTSINEWDCTELIQSIIFSCSFSTSVPGSKKNTLSQMYVQPKKLAGGSFHPSITGATQEETVALSVDQLRRLRNKACHSSSSKEIDKVNFDKYVQLTKDVFKELGVTSTVINNIGSLTEHDFPTGRVRTLENDFLLLLRHETETEEKINDLQQMSKDIHETVLDIQEKNKETVEMVKNIPPDVATKQDVEAVKEQVDHLADLMMETQTESKTVPVLSQSYLPPRVPHFVGREKEINEVTSYLVNDMARVVSIWGSVGFGKTALATELGHRLSDQDKLVIYVSLKSIATAEALVGKFLDLFEVQIPERSSNIKLLDVLCRNFRAISQPCILVLDNIDDLLAGEEGQKEEFVDTILAFIQSNAELRVVCTSRENMRYCKNKVPASSLKLNELETNDSIQLLEKILSDKISNQECRQLSKIFFNVPLALVLASSLISEDNVEPADLVKHVKDNPTAVIEVIDEEDNPYQMRRLIEYSFSRLSLKYQEKFVELAVFPGTFDAEAAASVLQVNVLTVKKDLGLLQRKSLVEFDEKTKRYSLHDFMKAFLQIKTRKNDDLNQLVNRGQCRFFDHYLSMVERINNDFLSGEAFSAIEKFKAEKENLTSCLKEAIKNSEMHEKAVAVLIEMDLLLDTVYWTNPKTITTFYENWIAECESRNETLNVLQLRISLSFGYLYWPTNKADMLLSETNMPQRRHETLPPEIKGKWLCYYGIRQIHLGQQEDGIKYLVEGVRMLENKPSHMPIKVIVSKILATYYNAKGKKDLADSTVKAALSSCPNEVFKLILLSPKETTDLTRKNEIQPLISELVYCLVSITRKFGSNKENDKLLQTLQCISENPHCLYQVAETYSEIGNIDEALKLHQKVLQIREYTLGDHEDTAQSHYSVGVSYFRLNDFTNALKAYKKALGMREKLLGDPEDTADSYYYVGVTYFKLNDFTNALEAFKKALSMREKLLGDHEETADSYHYVGVTYFKLNDFTNALEAYKKALSLREKLLGDHEETAQSHYSVGVTYFELNDFTNALEAFKKALSMREKLLGDHEETAQSYYYVGVTYFTLNDFTNALEAYKKALSIREKLLGDHEETAQSHYSVGVTYFKLNDFTNALEANKKALSMREKLLGDHEDTAQSHYSVAAPYLALNDFTNALEAYKKALSMKEKLLGDHKETAQSHYYVGVTYFKLSNFTNALEAFKKALSMREKLLGDHEETAQSYYYVGVTYFTLNDFTNALEAYKKALSIREKLLGDHEDTAQSHYSVAAPYLALNDFTNALEAYKKALSMREKLLGDHKETAQSHYYVGVTYFKLSNFTNALEAYKKALSMREKLLGDHEDTAESYYSVGLTYFKLNDFTNALEAFKKALSMREKLLGDHKDTAQSHYYVGVTYFKLNDFINAHEAHEKALRMREKLLGDHEDTAESYYSVGVTFFRLNDFTNALEAHKKALSMREKLLGDHKDTARSHYSVGETYFELNDFTNALEAYKKALSMREKLLGDHKDTAQSLYSVGGTYLRLNDFTNALEACKKALSMREKLLGDHEDTAQSHYLVGVTYFELNDFTNALEAFKKALSMREKLLGDHKDTAQSHYYVGVTYFKLNDFINAHEAHEKALRMREKLLGDHEDTAESYYSVGVTFFRLNDFTNALEAHKKALSMREKLLGDHKDTVRSHYSVGETYVRLNDFTNFFEAVTKARSMWVTLQGDHEDTAQSH